MKIFAGTNYLHLALDISKNFEDFTIGNLQIDKFSDGEILPCFKESIRDIDVFFINSSDSSDSIMETLLVVDAAKRAGCKSFTLVSPYSGYSRQDKTDHLRSSIGSKLLADIFEKAGVNRLITIDLHSSSIQGFYNFPVIHLNGNVVSIDYIKSLDLVNLCIVAPDQGAVKRASDFCKAFPEATFALINKRRIKPNEIHSMELVGEVKGKNVIIVDDMADTLGTMSKACELLLEKGALSVRCVATHGILSGKALENLHNSKIEEVIVIDTLHSVYDKSKLNNRIKIISCAKLIAKSISALVEKKSIHEINRVYQIDSLNQSKI
jgi:ribose-phosphate pyrophosphokinase